MSRPIAYNASGPLSGSIRGGNVNYTVDSGNRDYTTFASKKWVPSADGAAPIVFVTDTYTQGFQGDPSLAVPLFYSCAGTGSAAIIYTANRIPGSPGNYSDANVALNDLITARGYFILESNDPFEGVDADGLALDLDAAKMSSYPQVGTNWRDLSGNGNTGALTNGPTFILSSGSFLFDGIDDSVQVSNNNGFGTAGVAPVGTLSFTANLQRKSGGGTQLQQVAGFRNGSTFEFFFLLLDFSGATVPTEARIVTNGGIYDINVDFTSYFDKWTRVDFIANSNRTDLYFNGNLVGSNTSVSSVFGATSGNFIIGNYPAAGYPTKGQIQDTRFYTRALPISEIKQNYFGAPIVTDGLVFAVDANNIVSYPKSGTSTYNLTGSGATGTLTNGTSFNISNGGSFMFDGTNDYIVFPNDTNLDSQAITMESWSKINVQFQNAFLFEKGQVNSQYSNFYNGDGTFYFRTMGLSNQDLTFYYPSYVPTNTWSHIVCTYGAGVKTIYVNGVQVTQTTGVTGTISTDPTGLFLGAYGPGSSYFLNGNIAQSRVYNRALTAAEVQQNYQAEQYRFETPAGIVTNGLVAYWDAGNLDSYPGTGTTWYTLAGSINGTLTNGVGFNQINGGILTFDGVDDFIQYASLLNVGNTFTVNCWIKPTANLRQTIVSDGYPYQTNKGFFMTCPGNNQTDFFISLGQDQKIATSGMGMITTGAWQMVTARVNGASELIKLYVNGVETTYSVQTDANITLQYDTGVFTTGCRNGVAADDRLYSNFATLQIYNRALSTAEIIQNYNYFKGRFGL